MSCHLYVYVGWFFKVPKVMTEKVTKKTACVNTECASHGMERRTKFCQDCGRPLGTLEDRKQLEEQLNLHRVDDEWTDVMFQAGPSESGEHFWLPNHNGHGTTMSDYQDNEVVFMDSEKVKEEYARFKGRYSKFADAIEATYGVKLTPAYGVLPYHN